MIKKESEGFRIIEKLNLIILMLIFSISIISAAGVANSYWDENPLKLAPGESTIISLRLQNEEEQQITMEASLDSEIASLVDGPEYIVPPNKVSVPVYIKISIPKDSEIGTKYSIPVSFKQIASGEGGMVQVAQGITSKIPIEVSEKKESELYSQQFQSNKNLIFIIIITALVIAGTIYLLLKKKKK